MKDMHYLIGLIAAVCIWTPVHAESRPTDQTVFFVGLWSKITAEEHAELSGHLRQSTDDKFAGLRSVMSRLSARLADDREVLKQWVSKQGLESEIEVQSIPRDGSFLLLKASQSGIEKVRSAARAGHLPPILLQLGS